MIKSGAYITMGELANHLNCKTIGDNDKKIYGISLYKESTENTLTYIPGNKIDYIPEVNAGVILTKASIGLQIHRNYIIVPHDPYQQLADTIKFMIEKKIYYTPNTNKPIISESAVIENFVSVGNNSVINEGTHISPGVMISENVRIGKNCFIGANTVIGADTVIGDNVSIGACCSIGTENFEYSKIKNIWSKIPVVGNVNIHDNVIIGGNVVIEKGTIGTTSVGSYTHIENLIQIGHEVKIGSYCHIVACTALAGWSEIGDHVDIYGQAAVSNNVKIGSNTIMLARTGADKDVPSNSIISGFPAQKHKDELQQKAFLRKLFRKNVKGSEIK